MLENCQCKFGTGAAFVTGFNGEWLQQLHTFFLIACSSEWRRK
ncbi:hypothetical protein O5541_03580 [Escherichia coli]|nr:hypothetical protein [Escherichia coli]